MGTEYVGAGNSFCFIFMQVGELGIYGKHYTYSYSFSRYLPPYQNIKRSEFINTHEGLGPNIPCDLYNEHVSIIITNMEANRTDESMHHSPPDTCKL